ncbi:type II toxin-antitoxin system HigB family toxin [Roseateles sp. GG27B]
MARAADRNLSSQFASVHADAAQPLLDLRCSIEAKEFANFAQHNATFDSEEKVSDHYEFNIGCNKYRLVAGWTLRTDGCSSRPS